jgi:phosphoenolpyruvate carboxykinase (GTP)
MDVQFKFFNSPDLNEADRPKMAGLNYFLTHENRGGPGSGLLGEKKDVRVWLGWLERYVHGEVDAIETPIGFIPKYDDLQEMFAEIDKDYPKSLYDMQFALYVDNIVARIDLQTEAYGKEENLPATLFEVYEKQKAALLAVREKFGPVVRVDQLIG